MTRPKEFDRDEALEKALDAFWEKGYESTSIQNLVDRMGIGRASLYDTFGNKHQVFSEALDRYTGRLEAEVIAPLRKPGSPRRILTDFFSGLVNVHCCPDHPSCLVAKSALITCREDKETDARVVGFIVRLEDTFHEILTRARDGGEIDRKKNLRALARFLTNSMMGLSVISSVRRDRKVLQDTVRMTLSALD